MKAFRLSSLLLTVATVLPSAALAVLPLRDQWRAACQALSNGDAVRAAAAFEDFNAWYAGEPEAADPQFQEGLVRLWGLAALQAGQTEAALELLEKWLADFTGQSRHRAFIRFQLAAGYRSLGLEEEAIRHWAVFIAEHPDLPETALVHWMWADLLVSLSRPEEARAHPGVGRAG